MVQGGWEVSPHSGRREWCEQHPDVFIPQGFKARIPDLDQQVPTEAKGAAELS